MNWVGTRQLSSARYAFTIGLYVVSLRCVTLTYNLTSIFMVVVRMKLRSLNNASAPFAFNRTLISEMSQLRSAQLLLLLGRIACTRCKDAAYCYRYRTQHGLHVCVCVSVCLCVGLTGELCKDGWTDRDVVYRQTRVSPMNHVLDGVKMGRIHLPPRDVTRQRCGLLPHYFGHLLGRLFDRVDLIKPVSNGRPPVRACVRTYVRACMRPSVHKKFLRLQWNFACR